MSILGTIIIGFIVGLIARWLMPSTTPLGCILTVLLGIGGAVVGKFVGQALGMYKGDDPAGFFMSLVGALIILYIHNLLSRRTS